MNTSHRYANTERKAVTANTSVASTLRMIVPSEIGPPYREIGVARPLSHYVFRASQTIAGSPFLKVFSGPGPGLQTPETGL